MGEQEYITRQEHNEFARRFEGEEDRQNARLATIERRVDDLWDMKTSMNAIAMKIDMISNDLVGLRKEVDEIRQEPADNWKHIKRTLLSVIVTALATAAVAALLHFM